MNRFTSKLLLLIFNPFISAIISLKDIRDGVSHKILYGWFIIFGIAFSALSEQADSFAYVEQFSYEHLYSWNHYCSIIEQYLTFDTNITDIYTLSVNYFVGRFSDNYHWTFFIYAIVFGFFYIKSLRIFLRHNEVRNNWVFYMLLFLFCYSNPIFNINGVRFWTASWIGVYTALNLFVEKDWRKFPLLFLMPLMHGASFIWFGVIAFAYLVRNFQTFVIVIYIASSFVSAVSFLDILQDNSDIFPLFIQNKIWSYTESEHALERMSGETEVAYAKFLLSLPGIFMMLMSYLLIFIRKSINLDKNAGKLLTIMLAMAAVTNFLSGIPSVNRFQYLVIPFLIIVWASNYKYLKKYNHVFYLIPIFYAYSLLYWFRHMYAISEIYLYILPAPVTIAKYLII